jgi:hypothetical protein
MVKSIEMVKAIENKSIQAEKSSMILNLVPL